jgi:hypothetical protein
MTKKELIALSDLNREDNIKYISSEAQGIAIALDSDRYAPTLCKLERAYICGRRKSEEQIAELEEKISVLLSCKNCPENKGGYICEKEYNDKCLAQKIQYIKELKEENADLKEEVNKIAFARGSLEEENAELNNFIMQSKKDGISPINALIIKNLGNQLTKAKEIISEYIRLANLEKEDTVAIWQLYHKAEQFIKDSEVKE